MDLLPFARAGYTIKENAFCAKGTTLNVWNGNKKYNIYLPDQKIKRVDNFTVNTKDLSPEYPINECHLTTGGVANRYGQILGYEGTFECIEEILLQVQRFPEYGQTYYDHLTESYPAIGTKLYQKRSRANFLRRIRGHAIGIREQIKETGELSSVDKELLFSRLEILKATADLNESNEKINE